MDTGCAYLRNASSPAARSVVHRSWTLKCSLSTTTYLPTVVFWPDRDLSSSKWIILFNCYKIVEKVSLVIRVALKYQPECSTRQHFPKNTKSYTLEVRIKLDQSTMVIHLESWVMVLLHADLLKEIPKNFFLLRKTACYYCLEPEGELKNTRKEERKTSVNMSLLTYAIIYRPPGWVILFVHCRAF